MLADSNPDQRHKVSRNTEDPPLGDGTADLVWSIAAVHHWPDFTGGIAECHRVLRVGGHLVFAEKRCEPGAGGLASHGWTRAQASICVDALQIVGFTDARAIDLRADRPYLVITATRP